MTISIRSNPDGVTGAIQVNGVDAVGIGATGITTFAGGGSAVSTTGTQTLTNKTISGASNTITNISLTTGVTGTLPIANGGTGTTSTQFANLATNVTGTLPIANGGTGAATLTANNVLLGNGTSALQAVAPGTSGNVLTSNGTTWTSASAPQGNLVLVQSATGSGVDTVEITSGLTSTYRVYKLYLQADFTGSTTIYWRLYLNGTLNTASGYYASYTAMTGGGSTPSSGGTSSQSSATFYRSGFEQLWELTIFNPSDIEFRHAIHAINTSSTGADGPLAWGFFGSAITGTSTTRAITGIQATSFSTNGTWNMRLYGIKE